MKILNVIVLTVLCVGAICGCVANRDQGGPIQSVMREFAILKSQNQLPGLSSEEHGETSAYCVDAESLRADWFASFRQFLDARDSLVAIDVRSDERHLYYFFATTKAAPDLVAAFEQVGKQWKKIDRIQSANPSMR